MGIAQRMLRDTFGRLTLLLEGGNHLHQLLLLQVGPKRILLLIEEGILLGNCTWIQLDGSRVGCGFGLDLWHKLLLLNGGRTQLVLKQKLVAFKNCKLPQK